jgi:NADH:ubiquinone oxidoreductase subunit 6 (subunit J)
MTPNAVAFYAIAVLIVLAAGAAVGLPSLRRAAYAGAAVVVLMALLELFSGAYALAVVQLVVPAVGAGVVVLVLRRDKYSGLVSGPVLPERFWIAAPIAVGTAAVLVITLAVVGNGWYPGNPVVLLPAFHNGAALATVLHYRAPYALVIAVVVVVVTIGAALVIGRPSADEQTLDQMLEQRRQREDLARRRRVDREQGRRRPAGNGS